MGSATHVEKVNLARILGVCGGDCEPSAHDLEESVTNLAIQQRRWAHRLLAVSAAFALALGTAIVGGAAPANAATTYSVSGTLTGKTAAGTSVALHGVFIYLYKKDPTTGYFSYANEGEYTSSTGAYTITAPSAGTYTLHYNYCSSEGSTACKPAYVEEYLGHAETSAEAATFTLTTSAPSNVSNIQIEAASTITGTVKDSAGAPLAGAQVTANRPGGYNGPYTTTNASGVYTISRASSKQTIVEAHYWDETASNKTRKFYNTIYWKDSLTKDGATPLPLTTGSTKSGINFTLTQAPSIHGRAVDSTGKGIANLGYMPYVLLDNGQWDGPHSGPNLTDADGWFARMTTPGSSNKIAFFDDLGAQSEPGTVTRTVPFATKFYKNSATISGATVITAVDHARVVLDDTVLAPFSGAIKMAGDYHLSDEYGTGNEVYAEGMLFSPEDVTTTRQWYRDGVAISGATDYSYYWVDADRGKALTQRVTASRPGSSPATFTSQPYQVPGLLTSAPTPTITGTAKVGSELTATAGVWAPAPVALRYQWLRNGTTISGATTSTYGITPSDLGATLSVAVTGTKTGYDEVTKTSAPTGTVVAGTLTAATPVLTGSGQVGSAETVTVGTWGPGTVTKKYQWYVADVAVSGATASTFIPPATALGKTIRVKVTGSKSGYTTVGKLSAPVTVTEGTLTAGTPTIIGKAAVASILTAKVGTWSPAAGNTYTYQWFQRSTVNGTPAAISGATAPSYTVRSTYQGKYLSVTVTAKQTGYAPASATSAPTSAVLPKAVSE